MVAKSPLRCLLNGGDKSPPKIVGYPVRGLTLSCAAAIESTAEGKPSTVLFLRMKENG